MNFPEICACESRLNSHLLRRLASLFNMGGAATCYLKFDQISDNTDGCEGFDPLRSIPFFLCVATLSLDDLDLRVLRLNVFRESKKLGG